MQNIAFIGFGEAAAAFAATCLPCATFDACGFDVKSAGGNRDLAARFSRHGVRQCGSASEAVRGADVIFSLVTADQSEAAALAAAPLKPNCLYLDGNSCSPETKRRNADTITRAGGGYVDMAIMAPVCPDLRKVTLLLSGPDADRAHEVLGNFGLMPRILPGDVGAAASVKMIRSVLIKGLEALLTECTLAGVRAGVDGLVFETLEQTYPGFDWQARANYMMERMLVHGTRRAAEMEEVAKTVAELGVPGEMSAAAIVWQARMGAVRAKPQSDDYRDLAKRVIGAIRDN